MRGLKWCLIADFLKGWRQRFLQIRGILVMKWRKNPAGCCGKNIPSFPSLVPRVSFCNCVPSDCSARTSNSTWCTLTNSIVILWNRNSSCSWHMWIYPVKWFRSEPGRITQWDLVDSTNKKWRKTTGR